jgi:hypothetical protein
MKKYSKGYFEKKFHLLYEKLLNKENFIDTIKKARKSLNIPEEGFKSELDLVSYFIDRIPSKELDDHIFCFFCLEYAEKTGLELQDENKKEFFDNFYKKRKETSGVQTIAIPYFKAVEDHLRLFTGSEIVRFNKKNEILGKNVDKIFDAFMEVELLDAQIISHYIEKYLFLGEKGVEDYIHKRTSCPNCKYYSVLHFSPDRNDMINKEDGPFSGKYLFNKKISKFLSRFFDSYFIFIKPYATKGEVLNYIEDNWDTIKQNLLDKNTFYKQYDFSPSRLRNSNLQRNRLVYELYKKSKKELLEICMNKEIFPATGVYKEDVISQILKEKYDLNMSSDAVKKTATRFAKSIKTRKTAKDIGDI